MSGFGPSSLPDILAQVPDLLPQCMPHIDGRGARIRDLRLISKALSVTAMREVTSCSVQMVEGAWSNLGQVVRLMRHTKLHSLTVVIITTSGEGHSILFLHSPADTFICSPRLCHTVKRVTSNRVSVDIWVVKTLPWLTKVV